MKAHLGGKEIVELPFWAVVAGVCALIASAILWG